MIDDILEALLWFVCIAATYLAVCWGGLCDYTNKYLSPIPIGHSDEWMVLAALLLAAFSGGIALWFHHKK